MVEPWGLAGDRRWMVVDDDGAQFTAREHPQLILVRPRLRADGGLDLSAPDLPGLRVEVPDAAPVPVSVWRSHISASPGRATRPTSGSPSSSAGRRGWSTWTIRPGATPTRTSPLPGDWVSFADGYPLLLATEESLDAPERRRSPTGPTPTKGRCRCIRFRPSVVSRGARRGTRTAGGASASAPPCSARVKGCDRVRLTLIDPDTATQGQGAASRRSRGTARWDGATWFGMNLVPDTPGVQHPGRRRGGDPRVGARAGRPAPLVAASAPATPPAA